MASKYKFLVIHCSATKEGLEVSPAAIEYMHRVKRGWSRCGYSDLITLDGRIHNLHWSGDDPHDDYIQSDERTWGVKGQNQWSKHVCYIGGVENKKTDGKYKPKDTRTHKQYASLAIYVKHEILRHPTIQVAGHYHFAAKACPSFNVENFLDEIGVAEEHIYRKPK